MTNEARTDFAHDVFKQERHPLDPFFTPRSVAVVGATEAEGSVGRTILWNLLSNPFGGTVYPVNPKRPSVLGIRAYPSLKDVPSKIDLAVVVTPAPTVPGIIAECAELGVPAALVISAGFKELGPPGIELERRVLAEARRGRMRVVGPNCLGIMNPTGGLNATFAAGMARSGSVAFLSQSGALLTAILDWSQRERVGFSGFVSMGSMLDVGWGDLIDYFGNDPRTRAIVLYMETVGDARSFISAAREVALSKPIIVLKAGRTSQAARAAASHTGSLAGSDEVLDAAFRRSGVLRVSRIGELFGMADVLSKQPRPVGPRLTIVTNAGGPAVLATDALVGQGGELAALSEDARTRLDAVLPVAWSHNNPIDILGDATPERYAKALEIAAGDPSSDGLLVVLTPQDMTEPTLTAEALHKVARSGDKPVLASWMGGASVQGGAEVLSRAGIPSFEFPDAAAETFCYMWRYTLNLRGLYETPAPTEDGGVDPDRVASILGDARGRGRTLLTELESKQVLAAYRIPTVETRLARSEDEAVAAAESIGYPVVVKLHSETITHKTDVGGVVLGLRDGIGVARAFREVRAAAVRAAGEGHFQGVSVQQMIVLKDAYELIVGSSLDPQFGPVLLFGAGGQLVEVMKDSALALPPLNATLARRLMERTKIHRALQGIRGRAPVDVAALESLLVRFSQLVVDQPWIKEIDINPLLASPEGLCALDARVVLHDPTIGSAELPRTAIRPYPRQYAGAFTTRQGTPLTLRPIRPEDEPLMVVFHRELSEQTVRQRYFAPLKLDQRTAHERLLRICFSDYDRELALVALHRPEGHGAEEIVAVGRLSKSRAAPKEGEFAILVKDTWQRRGVGSELLRRIVEIARAEGLDRVEADILAENRAMLRTSERLGFRIEGGVDDRVVKAIIDLRGA
jgi:acetyltransferase